jgi:cytochrome c oxidase cbb3-type subunit I/II
VTRVVRTDLGELKWMEGQATDYSPLQQRGREVYTREGCWYCHSQYVRPVTGETRRWGPVTQAGEYAFDLPHLFSTRRIGPDLSRVGLKYSDEWHLAHFWDPRMVCRTRSCRASRGCSTVPIRRRIVTDAKGTAPWSGPRPPSPVRLRARRPRILLTPNAEGLLFVPGPAGKYPVIFTPNDEFTGDTGQLVADTEDLRALVAYLQKLGMNRGKWRDRFEPQRLDASRVSIPALRGVDRLRPRGLWAPLPGCHGERGDGNGPAATFMHQDRPAGLHLGLFKFRLTPSGSLPDRRRPAAHHHPGRARHGHAHLAHAAG